MKKKNEYEWITPEEFTRHPLHEKMLLDPEEKNQCGYAEAILKYGKLRPVLYIEDEGRKDAIDGWGYIAYARANNLSYVLALKVLATTEEEITQVIAEANSTYHTSTQSQYRMAEGLFAIYSKGQGYRSDLEDAAAENKVADENMDDAETSEPIKKLTIYERIGQIMGGLPGTRIKHLLFVGRLNPLYLHRMDVDRMSLYAAYLNCKKEEEGNIPGLPPIKTPEYYSNDTGAPEFGESTSTADTTARKDEDADETLSNPAMERPLHTDSAETEEDMYSVSEENSSIDVPQYITVKGICTHCNQETEITININQLNTR